ERATPGECAARRACDIGGERARHERRRVIGPRACATPFETAGHERRHRRARACRDAYRTLIAPQLGGGVHQCRSLRSGRHRAYPTDAGSIPRVAKTRATASPILLLGVLAPAVSPTRTGPCACSHSGTSTCVLAP